MIEAAAILIVVGAALVLRLAVAAIMRRLSIDPVDEAERSEGFRDVLRKAARRRDVDASPGRDQRQNS